MNRSLGIGLILALGLAAMGAADPEACEVTVVDRDTGRPLVGATIDYSLDLRHHQIQTDAEGRARIVLAGRKLGHGSLVFDVWDDDHVQQRHWFTATGPKARPVPERVTVSLLPGSARFGGVVQDEEGRPIAGARVRLWGHLDEMKDPTELLYMIHVRTDAAGRWQARGVRRMKFLNVYLDHPDFLSDGTLTDRRYTPPTDALINGTDVQVMKRGLPVAGRVLEADGRPVAGCSIVATPSPNFLSGPDLPTTTTDADGRFQFPHSKAGPLHLIAQAKGHGPGTAVVTVAAGLEPVEISLAAARPLIGRVFDPQGRPIAGAFVYVESWRRYRCLGVYLATDDNGRFRWDEAPTQGVVLSVSHESFVREYNLQIQPGDDFLTITLQPALSISGTVRDAISKKWIEKAQVETGLVDPTTREVTWHREVAPTNLMVSSGNLQGDIDATAAPAFRFRITAPGYKPAISPEYASNAGQVVWDVFLEKNDAPAKGP